MEQTKTKDHVYTMIQYWQQGDDLSDHLEEAGNDLPVALHNWGQQISMASHMIHDLAIRISKYLKENQDEEITTEAYCHRIEIDGPEDFLDDLVDQHLLIKEDVDQSEDLN